jgi:HAD superfamily hydrolase (TIGR01509 family)
MDKTGDVERPRQGVIFDMDGTLTRPYFDFDRIRQEIGLTSEPRMPILEAVAAMSAAEAARARAILERYEHEAATASELHDGALEVIAAIRSRGWPVGLLTRNSRVSTDRVIARHALRLDCVHTREDGPVKPSPDAILAMCRRWNVPASQTWMVGDYLFDIQAGRAAGARTVLMIGQAPLPEYAAQADHVIRALPELLALIE